jgi:hypothetical protein
LTGVNASSSDCIRARGFTLGGLANGSSWPVEAVLGPPFMVIGAGLGFVSNRFAFTIFGRQGQVVVTEASTNLVHWLPLQTNILSSGSCSFSEPASRVHPRRFYRLRLLP